MLEGSLSVTLLIGPGVGVPLPAPASVMDALTSVQVTVTAGQRNGFQLSFAVSRESELMTTLLPAGYFDPKTRVIIVATVRGVPTVLMDGVMIRTEVGMANEGGRSTLTVSGQDLTVLMDLEQNKIPWPVPMPELAIMAIIAKYAFYGIVPMVIPFLLPVFKVPVIDGFFQQDDTDAGHIKKLADKYGYVFYLIPGPLPGMNVAYFGPDIRIGIPQPALTVDSDAATNVESLTFAIDGASREQLAIQITEPITKVSIPIPVPDISILRPPLAIRPLPSLKYRYLNGSAKEGAAEAVGEALGQAGKFDDAVTGSGQLDVLRYGQFLSARELVGVRGAGLAYDGLYYVSSVTTTLSRGEAKQSFTLSRNGVISITPAVPV